MKTDRRAGAAAAAACAPAAAERRRPTPAAGPMAALRRRSPGWSAGRDGSELGAEALRRSGARALRWIRPGDMVTMDYSARAAQHASRRAGRVERFACG